MFSEQQTPDIFIFRKNMVIFSGVEVDFLLMKKERWPCAATPKEEKRWLHGRP